MKSYQDLKSGLRKKLGRARAIMRLVDSEDFEKAFISNPDEKVLQLITNQDRKGLISWIRATLIKLKKPEEMKLRELRDFARSIGVRNYCELTRVGLLARVREYDNHSRGKSPCQGNNETAPRDAEPHSQVREGNGEGLRQSSVEAGSVQ